VQSLKGVVDQSGVTILKNNIKPQLAWQEMSIFLDRQPPSSARRR
jgi:hypothetical protein